MAEARRHRFLPRYRGLAWGSIGVGGGFGIMSAVIGFATLPLVAGALGIAFGLVYLGSPTWKIEVVTDAAGLEVRAKGVVKFRLAWSDVVRVVASPTTNSAFVDGGAPERSLLVPGDGAPAPYAIEDAQTLVQTIISRVVPERVKIVETLDAVDASEKPA